ncbi:flagellar hook-associated protein 1 FlgK [Desulfomicrobium norvegicum]|uniref:Flagellar hook-associated protein 1 n=1 Tax=Desulfomicrobium norvegicum (strain DSM 1741 / NCIMB 8310) TaxID=52561 RepID=A0A8G2F679_DESNO|nr:flagellar hook-associated protein FlgK [Desulfomicrobium norvegicum]SFL32430.1 flagellar hook-associated protein 1 FlgK [Desulfomicrobium norvegicum]
MPGIASLFNIGKQSLFANQSAIEVVGNNISNANTEGYSRQAVRFEDGYYISYTPGQLGTGVNAAEVIRYFDEFTEIMYNDKSSEQQRWQKLYENLQNVEMIFNESNAQGVNSALSAFWADWQTLATSPDNQSVRSALLGHASNLEQAIGVVYGDLQRLQSQTDDTIHAEVGEINTLLESIAALNKQITVTEETGKNNANGLRDERAALVRKLAEKIDIRYIDNGLGNVTITTQAGHTLVDGVSAFRLAFDSPTSIANLKSTSTYKGLPTFDGESSSEYTIEIRNDPPVDVPLGSNETLDFRISVDGGKTWMTNEAGGDVFKYTGEAFLLPDGKGTLTFPVGADVNGTLQKDDRFQILPKKSLFWYETTSSRINITPQIMPNGEDNERRLTGGTLAGYFQFRDASVGGYIEKLDAFSKSLAWEVNRIHSQGTGLERFEQVAGTYGVTSSELSLQTGAGSAFGDKLEDGNLMIGVYDKNTGAQVQFSALDFSADAGVQNFVAKDHSLESVVGAINRVFPGKLTASVLDNHLQIEAADGYDFAFGSDSTGLLAALGINTFFDGSDAQTLSLNNDVRSNISRINTGHVNGAGEMNEGDNTTAAALAALQNKAVTTRTVSEGKTIQTLGEYYSTLVAKAGSDTQSSKFNYEYQQALANDLRSRQESVSGVNLDEEMTNLIKFQHAYTAAAKLITTAESMLQVLLGLKN